MSYLELFVSLDVWSICVSYIVVNFVTCLTKLTLENTEEAMDNPKKLAIKGAQDEDNKTKSQHIMC
jgi:hypothetical protein